MSFIKKIWRGRFQYLFPNIFYFIEYWRASKRIKDEHLRRKVLFNRLILNSKGKVCLQIGVRKNKYAYHWISVDLYDKSDYIDYNYDIHDLKFKDNTFDVVVCNAILEHVEFPEKAIKELYRVLKPQGEIWVEVANNQPYHPSPNDYWRVTLPGLKILMKDFVEISSGFFTINHSPIYTAVYFYGRKS
ncbi:MAG: class I SAM-dependent methyltransferase [Endomicrobia bacterium]|nr:class I SAM-dependent methyltransferase [Endomicrobiia bacterium]